MSPKFSTKFVQLCTKVSRQRESAKFGKLQTVRVRNFSIIIPTFSMAYIYAMGGEAEFFLRDRGTTLQLAKYGMAGKAWPGEAEFFKRDRGTTLQLAKYGMAGKAWPGLNSGSYSTVFFSCLTLKTFKFTKSSLKLLM
jgi:hypothetical protein